MKKGNSHSSYGKIHTCAEYQVANSKPLTQALATLVARSLSGELDPEARCFLGVLHTERIQEAVQTVPDTS